MLVLEQNSKKMKVRDGLYCIWEAVREGGRTILVARWIDPREASEADQDAERIEEEASRPWLHMAFRAA